MEAQEVITIISLSLNIKKSEMQKFFIVLILLVSCNKKNEKSEYDFETRFEISEGKETATYEQTILYFTNLAKTYPEMSMKAIGETDAGQPLHIVIFNPDKEFDFENIRINKRVILINNGIHPGESDGIDATMMLFRDLVAGKIITPKNTVLVTIPIYNIGGSLNRNSNSRANQNGPLEYGFRGNARNYDLNRDFIKCDTKNAKAFAEIFHLVQPDIFLDNHVSNGADYQYTLTHLFTQHNKLGGSLGEYLQNDLMPALEKDLANKNWDITPFVNVYNKVPEKGFSQFMDLPRYSTGYTTLFNTIGMMVETHMLKPYKQRVQGNYEFMKSMIEIVDTDSEKIKDLRKNINKTILKKKVYPLKWTIDSTKTTTINFKGFEGEMISSNLTGAQRLKYDRTKPFSKDVIYQNYFKPSLEVTIPKAYIIPQEWYNIIELLNLNRIEILQFKKDTIVNVEAYKIDKYETRRIAYEGHYQHYNTRVVTDTNEINFRKGDFLIYTNQIGLRYLVETLEPAAPDSFFNWNFFDAILQQKEHFSPYVWEDYAIELLDNNPDLKATFESKKDTDEEFATNWYAQLNWIYKRSDHYEKAHLQYPVYRIK